jgi:hypothetical protein
MSKKKSLEDILQSIDQRNPTMNTPVGPIPRPKTPQGVHKQEKKNLKTRGYTGTGYSGSLMGGSSSSTFTNTSAIRREQRTFGEFMSLAEGKKKKSFEPKDAVPGTYKLNPDGSSSYTLRPADPSEQRKLSKKQVLKSLEGRLGRKAVLKGIEKRKKELKKLSKQQEAFSYGSKSFQQELEKKRKKEQQEKETQRQQNADTARRAFRTKGVPFSDAKGKGHIVNGVKHYDT